MSTASATGEQRADVGGGIELCFESLGDPANPTVLLVMGLGMQLVAWDDRFCAKFTERGFHVVRYDNRDSGLSSSADAPPPTLPRLATRHFDPRQYDLGDLATDATGLLDHLGIESAHVVGASMGGMIAQTVAARHPERVRTLTSIMSMTGHPTKGQPAPSRLRYLLAPVPRDRDGALAHLERVQRAIASPAYPADRTEVRTRIERAYDRAHNPAGVGRQLAAILKSGNRTRELQGITAPTLVVHGSADTLVRPSGGKATAAAIPGAELMVVDGMGHDLPPQVWDRVVGAIADRAERFDAA